LLQFAAAHLRGNRRQGLVDARAAIILQFFHRLCQQKIPALHRRKPAGRFVDCGDAPALRRAVHHVVVYERCGMHQFQHTHQRDDPGPRVVRSAHMPAQVGQGRTQTFPSGEHDPFRVAPHTRGRSLAAQAQQLAFRFRQRFPHPAKQVVVPEARADDRVVRIDFVRRVRRADHSRAAAQAAPINSK
jgi:hypothetical protein